MNPTIRNITKAPKNHNRWCGPAAVSAITGVDTAQAASLFRAVNGKRSVKGTSIIDMKLVLARLGVHTAKATLYKKGEQPTLSRWIDDTRAERRGRAFLIVAGMHWRLVQRDAYVCGLTGRVVDVSEAPGPRSRVTHVFELEVMDAYRYAKPHDAVPAPKRRQVDPHQREARRLAREHGIEIGIDRYDGCSTICVWGPSWAEGDAFRSDPFSCDHSAENWREALDMVREYVSLMQEKPHLFRGV